MDLKIDFSMDEDRANRIKTKIGELNAELAFLVDLTPDQIKSLVKFGDKSFSFVSKTLELALQNPDVLPRGFNIDGMKRDVTLYNYLFSIIQLMRVLMNKLEDTFQLVGAQAYSSGLTVYKNMKTNQDLLIGAETILDELGRRFAQRAASPVPAPEQKEEEAAAS